MKVKAASIKSGIFLLCFNCIIVAFVFSLFACNSTKHAANSTASGKGIKREDWGEADGKKVLLFTLTNKQGSAVAVTNYGGTITSWVTADITGNKSNIMVGFDSVHTYMRRAANFGATIGRFANRIANAQFSLDGATYKLAANNGRNHMHGGPKGFGRAVWNADAIDEKVPSVTLRYFSKDGEEGYPGNLQASVKFTLTDADELVLEYNAETDKTTPINLTNHAYFNLTGDVNNTILNHTLSIRASHYLPVDSTLIPTGELAPVKGTAFDFTTSHKVGQLIGDKTPGYDHTFVLNKKDKVLERVAVLSDPLSQRTLEVFTTEPGVQLYTGNFLNGMLKNRDGKMIKKQTAVCLETQHFPDSPNKPSFPSTILRPGEKFHSVTKYKVSVFK